MEDCLPTPYNVPTLPARIPGYGELDKGIGLHVTGRYKIISLDTYRLKVIGNIDNQLELTYDQIRCLPRVTANPLLVCPGLFKDSASWTGVTIQSILDLTGVSDGAEDLVLVSAEGYRVRVPLSNILHTDSLLAYEVNGQILPILHGFPLRAVLPDITGMKWVKWLVEIQVK
jgi:DMSO/TMAO reductase YedYZ molybdopterin-dependent catalytic subunit